jgi:hypothetical protein
MTAIPAISSGSNKPSLPTTGFSSASSLALQTSMTTTAPPSRGAPSLALASATSLANISTACLRSSARFDGVVMDERILAISGKLDQFWPGQRVRSGQAGSGSRQEDRAHGCLPFVVLRTMRPRNWRSVNSRTRDTAGAAGRELRGQIPHPSTGGPRRGRGADPCAILSGGAALLGSHLARRRQRRGAGQARPRARLAAIRLTRRRPPPCRPLPGPARLPERRRCRRPGRLGRCPSRRRCAGP